MKPSTADAPWQWQVVRVDFEPVRGSEQAGARPALVISREASNVALPVLVVLPITTQKPGRIVHIGEVSLPAGCGGLPNASIAMCQQIRTISKQRVRDSYGYIKDEKIRHAVRQALSVHLDLDG